MKTLDDCLEIIKEEPYAHHVTLNEFVDADVANGILRGICNAYELGNEKSLLVFAKSLALEIERQIIIRAEEMSENSVNPLED